MAGQIKKIFPHKKLKKFISENARIITKQNFVKL